MRIPPASVLARTPTVADVRAWPQYFIAGPGYAIASTTDCGHGYHLTDSCPGCDADAQANGTDGDRLLDRTSANAPTDVVSIYRAADKDMFTVHVNGKFVVTAYVDLAYGAAMQQVALLTRTGAAQVVVAYGDDDSITARVARRAAATTTPTTPEEG